MFDLFVCECEFYKGKETIDPVWLKNKQKKLLSKLFSTPI